MKLCLFKKTPLAIIVLSVSLAACETTAPKVEVQVNQRTYRDMRQHTNNETNAVKFSTISVSPDAGTLAYSSSVNGNVDIFIKGVNSKAVTQKTDNPAYDSFPAISPDGTKLAFASNRNGNFDIYVTNMGGGKATRQITFGQEAEIAPSWSHDGKKIVYSKKSTSSNDWEIWNYNLETGSFSSITTGFNAVYSPINDSIVFQKPNNKQWYSLWITDDEGKEETNILTSDSEGYFNPTWSADGTVIAFVSGGKTIVGGQVKVTVEKKGKEKEETRYEIEERRGTNIWLLNSDGSDLTRITDSDKAKYFEPKFSTDGRLYFISEQKDVTNIVSVIPEMINTAGATRVAEAAKATEKLRLEEAAKIESARLEQAAKAAEREAKETELARENAAQKARIQELELNALTKAEEQAAEEQARAEDKLAKLRNKGKQKTK
jgi:Tol biopolymer transport system component